MVVEVSSSIFFITNLTHYQNFWALNTNMLLELSSGHMLILVSETDITTEFWAIELSMSLKFTKGLPNDFIVSLNRRAFMWELTEINTVFQNFINFSKEISFSLTIRAANIKIWSNAIVHIVLRHL
jgi:hypothetical protein